MSEVRLSNMLMVSSIRLHLQYLTVATVNGRCCLPCSTHSASFLVFEIILQCNHQTTKHH